MSQSIGRIKALFATPGGLRRAMNLWPPFLFTGVRITHIGADFREVDVRLSRSPLTTNYFGTHFGGSLFAMTDPFWTIMLARNLGGGYVVWDQRGEIEFVAAGRTTVTSRLVLDPAAVVEIRAAADRGEKVLRWFENDLIDASGAVVARARKQVYVRKARESGV